jgi:sialate O-acetylesterase
MTWGRHFAATAAAIWACGGSGARADVALPAIFGNHMVLEVTTPLPIWGTAAAGETVTVTAAGRSATAVADDQGRWRVTLPALPADVPAPFELVVEGKNRIVFSDVVVGEVWLASGQSNMEWPLYASEGAEADMFAATTPKLRLFQVKKPSPENLARTPAPIRGRWAIVTPESAARFSAVAYHFGRALAERRPLPIGIIHSSWGGSRIEPWMRRTSLASLAGQDGQKDADKADGGRTASPALRARLRAELAAIAKGPAAADAEAYRRALQEWEASRAQTSGVAADPGDRGVSLGFARAGTPPPGWRQAQVPGSHEEAAGRPIDGAIWWRREVALPSGFVGQPLFLRLGAVGQCDTTYVQGALVGATCETIAPERFPRGYAIPQSLTGQRTLTIAVRVWDTGGATARSGGLLGPGEAMRLVAGSAPDGPSISLAGTWWWRSESERADTGTPTIATDRERPRAPAGFASYQTAGVLWDNMVDQLAPFALRGVIWYQGESNTREAFAYGTLLPALIKDWRRAFHDEDLPFLLVQLAAHRPRWAGAGQRSADEWAELRVAQASAAARDPKSGMAVTIDLGAHDDIHPRNKREVGRRLALLALAQVHHEPVEASGPVYAGHSLLGDGRLRIRFRHATGLEAAAPPPATPPAGSGAGRLIGFEIAGADRQFVSAAAEIEGETVVLSAPGVPKPVAARYAFGDDPSCNLVNWAALPAAPFRTDRWPGFTQRQKP